MKTCAECKYFGKFIPTATEWLGRDSYGHFLRMEIRDEPNAAD